MAKIYFAFIALTLLGLSAYALYLEVTPEWKGYQQEYYRRLANMEPDANRAEQIEATTPKIEQVYNTEYGIVDRCTTCHLSYADPRFAGEEQPFGTHPKRILATHPIDRIGCAVCHDGNGYGTSVEAAHGFEQHDMRPLLTDAWIQSRCTRCHAYSNVPGVPILNRGLEIIDRAACFACHEIKQLPERERIAPNLDTIGRKVQPQWLQAWLLNPQAYLKHTLMPGYGLEESEALSITAYLMTLVGEAGPQKREQIPAGRSDLAEGERLFKKSACEDCHSVHESGGFEGISAPALSRLGDKVRRDWLVSWLQDPSHFQPATVMPGYGFTNSQAYALADYLISSFSTKNDGPDSIPANDGFEAQLKSEDLIAAGKKLARELVCFNCHAVAGARTLMKIGPELSDVGDWGKHHLEWGQVEHEEGLGLRDYLRIKLDTPRAFGENMIMPIYNFDPEEITAVIVALMSFSESPFTMKARMAEVSVAFRQALPAGDVGQVLKRYQCLTCHSLYGQFGHMATELSFEGDKVQKEWLADYLTTPHLIRPLMESRMPWFGMTAEEIQLITDYIDLAWQDDRVPEDPFDGRPPPETLVIQGENIYQTEYECAECHSIAGEGGDDGPALDGVGERLKPGWIFQWLLDPQKFYENDMPTEDVTIEDAEALTGYLMSLKR